MGGPLDKVTMCQLFIRFWAKREHKRTCELKAGRIILCNVNKNCSKKRTSENISVESMIKGIRVHEEFKTCFCVYQYLVWVFLASGVGFWKQSHTRNTLYGVLVNVGKYEEHGKVWPHMVS